MGGRPGLDGCRDQDEGDVRSSQPFFQSPVPAPARDRHDHTLRGPALRDDQGLQ